MTTEQWGWSEKQTPADELIIANILNNTLALYPESSIHGTGNCRAVIMSQSGLMIGEDSNKRFPLTIDLAGKISRYCGAESGKWDGKERFDEYPKNRVEGFYDISDPWVNDTVKDMRWKANLISVEYADTRTMFYPAFQTTCNNDSSIFNNLLVVLAATQIEKVVFSTWTKLVGNSRLKGKAFIDKSNEHIAKGLDGLFDGRFRIEVNTHFTDADKERNNSWTTDIELFSNVTKTVNNLTINGRYEDFA